MFKCWGQRITFWNQSFASTKHVRDWALAVVIDSPGMMGMTIIAALRRWRHEGFEIQASLCYSITANSAGLPSRDSVSIKQIETNLISVSSHLLIPFRSTYHILVYCLYCHGYFCILWHIIDLKCIFLALSFFFFPERQFLFLKSVINF